MATRQTGPVAFSLGPVNLTIEALRSSLVMVLRLVTIAAASAAVASAIPRERGIGLARWALQPASAFGADVAGPVLALDTAFALVPTMAEGIEGAMSERDLRLTSPELWRDVIPGVVAQLYTEAGMSRLA